MEPALSCGRAFGFDDGVVSGSGESGCCGGGRMERTEPRPVAAAAPPPAALLALRTAADGEEEEALIDIGVDLIDKEP